MKKIFFIAIVLLSLPGFAFAAAISGTNGVCSLGGGTDDALVVQMSNKVNLYYANGAAGTTFSVGTYHTQGNRSFASTSEDAVIYWTDGTGVEGYTTAPVAGTSEGAPSGSWDTL